MKVYVVRSTAHSWSGPRNLSVFSTEERAELERRFLAGLEDEDERLSLDETVVEEHVLDLSYEDVS